MATRKNFEFGPKTQEDLTWLEQRLEAATEAETVRRALSLLRHILAESPDTHVDIRREAQPDLRILL